VEQLFSAARQEFSLPVIADAQLFMPDTAPKAVKDLYGKALAPPALSIMDPVSDNIFSF
jgi:hypothetical protein